MQSHNMVLAAKDSSVVAQKNDHLRLALPQRTQPDFFPIGVGENQIRKPLAQSFLMSSPRVSDSRTSA